MADGFFPGNLLVLIKFVNGLVEGHDFLFQVPLEGIANFVYFPFFISSLMNGESSSISTAGQRLPLMLGIRRFTHGIFECLAITFCVRADFPLIDH